VIPKFECGTKFQDSLELVWSCDSGASRADEFWGGTSAGCVTGCVTGLELAKIGQKSHMSVTGHNRESQCKWDELSLSVLGEQQCKHIILKCQECYTCEYLDLDLLRDCAWQEYDAEEMWNVWEAEHRLNEGQGRSVQGITAMWVYHPCTHAFESEFVFQILQSHSK